MLLGKKIDSAAQEKKTEGVWMSHSVAAAAQKQLSIAEAGRPAKLSGPNHCSRE